VNRILRTLGAVAAGSLLLASCASGSLATSETDPAGTGSATFSATPTAGGPTMAGPTLVVTVPELVLSSEGTAPVTVTPTTDPPLADAPSPTAEAAVTAAPDVDTPAVPAPAPAEQAPALAPSGDGLNVSLANCDGCSVVATHRDVAGGRSAALVTTGSGRALLLSVGSDGQVAGVIGGPYGAAFPAPADGLLPCAQGRCVVSGRQTDGRAILSVFELSASGAWLDVSGDDAFPSATERSAVVDLDGGLGIAVQDQADGAAVWMLYTWGGDRFAVLGCAPDGDPPTTATGVSPANCLS
jgi:hypothetical protein